MARFFAAISVALLAAVGQASAQEEVLDLGRQSTADFQQGAVDRLWERMTDEMHQALGSAEALEEVRASLEEQVGAEEQVLSEDVASAQQHRVYLRTARHAKGGAAIVTQFAFDGEDRIAGFFVRPQQQAAESRFLDYETKAALRLPFYGEWYVYWGGRTPEQNYHVVDAGQRFAYDFTIERDGSSYAGNPHSLEAYHCWDEPVLAPADGIVAAVVDGLPDQEIGQRDPDNPAGNHVVLDFGEGEYGFLAHLRKGSVTVQEGDQVIAGGEIGRCGNSGNTSEPHLHFHLQTTPVLGEGEGLPAFFVDYVADGERVERGEPLRGQTVVPAGEE